MENIEKANYVIISKLNINVHDDGDGTTLINFIKRLVQFKDELAAGIGPSARISFEVIIKISWQVSWKPL